MVSTVWRSPPRQPRSRFICKIRMRDGSEAGIGGRVEMADHINGQSRQGASDADPYPQRSAMGTTELEGHPYKGGAHPLAKNPGGGLHTACRSAAMTRR